MISDYLESGLALVPVPAGKKGPTTKGWNLHKNVIVRGMDASQLNCKNVGLAHAYCAPTPTCAIDIDNFKLTNRWLATHEIDLKSALRESDAVVIWSGKKNSLKLLYRLPLEVGALVGRHVKCEDQSMMLEFRCASRNGNTLQDLLPPSVHPSGSEYTWLGEGNPNQIPEIPDSLLAVWQQLILQEPGDESRLTARVNQKTPETPRAVARVKEMLTYIHADCDYFNWLGIVWALLSTGWSCAIELARDWSKSAPERFDEDAFSRLIDSYDPLHESGYTIATVVHSARIGGWDE
jgi:putative DNA primase/helicase